MNNLKDEKVAEVSPLAHNMRFLRKANGMSQGDLAAILGIKRSSIAAYESKNVEPRISIIIKLAEFFDIDLSILLRSKLDTKDFKNFNQEAPKTEIPTIQVMLERDHNFDGFIEESVKIRKVLQGFVAFYTLQKSNLKDDFPDKSKMLFNMDNFSRLIENLLSYNEAVVDVLRSATVKQ